MTNIIRTMSEVTPWIAFAMAIISIFAGLVSGFHSRTTRIVMGIDMAVLTTGTVTVLILSYRVLMYVPDQMIGGFEYAETRKLLVIAVIASVVYHSLPVISLWIGCRLRRMFTTDQG